MNAKKKYEEGLLLLGRIRAKNLHYCVILPGVTIGRNSCIGANSVVNINIPDFSVAIGAPVKKVVKKYNNLKGVRDKT